MEAFSALLAFCAGNSRVTGEFPLQRPVTRIIDDSFDLLLNKRLGKQSWGWWFETPSRPLRRHSNVTWPSLKCCCWIIRYHACWCPAFALQRVSEQPCYQVSNYTMQIISSDVSVTSVRVVGSWLCRCKSERRPPICHGKSFMPLCILSLMKHEMHDITISNDNKTWYSIAYCSCDPTGKQDIPNPYPSNSVVLGW